VKGVRALRTDRATLAAAATVLLLVAAAIVVPYTTRVAYDVQDLSRTLESPNAEHWFGTDQYGRDLVTRLAYGGRISFAISGTAVLAHTAIGTAGGMLAGFLGGAADGVLMRVTDVFLAFPPILFLILITGVLGPSLFNIVIALSLVGWAGMARQVRAEALTLRGQEFIDAARALGATDGRIVVRHVLINVLTVALVRASLDIGPVILSEATLSFLGIGIQPPMPSWGVMIAEGLPRLRSEPYLALIPSVVLSLAILALTFAGEGIAEALDPRSRRR
jgi:ABC-type dipeptide/oligopeptide/nickel transport system permease subunit